MNIVILAAGLGKRMYSSLPKVLQPVGGKPDAGSCPSGSKTKSHRKEKLLL